MEYYVNLRDRILANVDTDRMSHTLKVEEEAIRLAKNITDNEEFINKASIAACAHDMFKHYDYSKNPDGRQMLNDLIIMYGEDPYQESLHALMASIILKNVFKIEDEDIINAVKYHSIPDVDCSVNTIYNQILYVADWTAHADYDIISKEIKEVSNTDILKAFFIGVSAQITKNIASNKPVHPRFITVYNELSLQYK